MPRDLLADPTVRPRYEADGYAPIADLASTADRDRLAALCDDLLTDARGSRRDLVAPTADSRGLVQLLYPERQAPEVLETDVVRSAIDLGQRLLPHIRLDWFTHAIVKPARIGAATPWHQDVGYDPRLRRPGCSIWLALDDAGPTSGCLRFVPGSHRGPILPHELADSRSGADGLAAVGPDVRHAVEVPTRAGSGSVHDHRTVHGAGPNTSDRSRAAFVVVGIARPEA